jgi:hypothetical protein
MATRLRTSTGLPRVWRYRDPAVHRVYAQLRIWPHRARCGQSGARHLPNARPDRSMLIEATRSACVAMMQILGSVPQNVNFAIQAPIVVNFLSTKDPTPKLDSSDTHRELPWSDVADHAKEFARLVPRKPVKPHLLRQLAQRTHLRRWRRRLRNLCSHWRRNGRAQMKAPSPDWRYSMMMRSCTSEKRVVRWSSEREARVCPKVSGARVQA